MDTNDKNQEEEKIKDSIFFKNNNRGCEVLLIVTVIVCVLMLFLTKLELSHHAPSGHYFEITYETRDGDIIYDTEVIDHSKYGLKFNSDNSNVTLPMYNITIKLRKNDSKT